MDIIKFFKNSERKRSNNYNVLCESLSEFHKIQKILFKEKYIWADSDPNLYTPSYYRSIKYFIVEVMTYRKNFSWFGIRSGDSLNGKVIDIRLKDLENQVFIDEIFNFDL